MSGSARAATGTDDHIAVSTTSTGALLSLSAGGRSLLLYPATDLEDGVAGLWLRRRENSTIRAVPLVGTASRGGELVEGDGALSHRGSDDGLDWVWRLVAAADRWTWQVEVTNTGTGPVEVDLRRSSGASRAWSAGPPTRCS